MRAAVVLVLVRLVGPTQAQDGREGELAEAIYGTFSLSSYVLTQAQIGHLPDEVDMDRFPADARVVGGFVLEDPWDGGDPIPFGVAYTEAVFSQALDTFFDSLPEGYGASTMGGNGWVDVCGPEPFPSVALVAREAGGTYMILGETVGPARPCDPAPDRTVEVETDPVTGEADVIGDGEIIDEPGEARKSISGPKIPAFTQDGLLEPYVESFGRHRGGGYTGSTTREVFSRATVAEVADSARTAFEADGWTRLGAYDADGTAVSLWSRVDDRDRTVVATVTVRPAYRSAVVTITATR